MNNDVFDFFLYRLNKEFRQDIFSNYDSENKPDDYWMKKFLERISNKEYDIKKVTKSASYIWSIRNYQELPEDFSSLVLARSQLQKKGVIVTENSLSTGNSMANPPIADTIILCSRRS